MSEQPGRPNGVMGPAGTPLTIDNLPPADTKRWVIRRKAEVVAAVRGGLIDLDEACARYRLSVEEFLNWERLILSHGLRGLRSTRIQEYRETSRETTAVGLPSQERTGRDRVLEVNPAAREGRATRSTAPS